MILTWGASHLKGGGGGGGEGGSNSINVCSPPDFRQTDTDKNRQNRQKLFFALGRFLDAYY